MGVKYARATLLAACIFAPLVSALYGPSSDVVLLSPSAFNSQVKSGNILLVEFFAPWCGHCKNLAPAWEKAATALKGVVTVAAVDCDANPSLAQEYGVQGFPTIKLFTPAAKAPLDYQGGRDAKAIVDYALSQVKHLVSARLGGKVGGGGGGSGGSDSGPSESVELTSANFDEAVLESKDVWLVEFFAPWCGHCKALAPHWKEAAKNLKGKVHLGQVDCTVEQALATKYKIQGFPTILVFAGDKENPTPYEGARTAGSIESFALELWEANLGTPEITQLTDQEGLGHCANTTVCFVAFFPHILDSKAEGRNRYLELLSAVAEKFKRKPFRYVWVEAGAQPALESAFGVGGYGYPALVAASFRKSVFSPFKSSFELEHLTEFLRSAERRGRGVQPLEGLPLVVTTEAWDGKDAEEVVEEEFSLEELMGDDGARTSDEL